MSTPLLRPYPKRVGPAPMPTGSAASVYQAPQRIAIQRFTFANTTGSTQTVTLNIVSQTGNTNVGNQIIPALPVPGNDVQIIKCPVLLEPGELIFALASGAVNLTFNVNDQETEGM